MMYAFLTVKFDPSFSELFLPATRLEQVRDYVLVVVIFQAA
ncbi:MAG TPA: hypothetical protein VJ785_01125 [Anaerolineales bacterium]|nr:hypothetical protein [Anaerolineales bacterium]